MHTIAVVANWMAARQFQVIQHLMYLPDLAPADLFLWELAPQTLMQETYRKSGRRM